MAMYGDIQQSLLVATRPQHQHHCGISSTGQQLLFCLNLIIVITRPTPTSWIVVISIIVFNTIIYFKYASSLQL